MPPQTLAAVAAIVSFAVHGNRIELRLDHGGADLTWISPGTFRFRRVLEGPLAPPPPEGKTAVKVDVEDLPGALRLESNLIEVTIQKRGALVAVRRNGVMLMKDLSEPRAEAGAFAWDREMPRGVRYYGLARTTDLNYDWRGKSVSAEVPFLIASTGYGEYHAGSGPFRFDFTGANRYRIAAPRMDYFFYHGDTPPVIFEERNATREAGDRSPPAFPQIPTWDGLRDALVRLTHGAMAGILDPVFDLEAFSKAPEDLLTRARQIGSLVPGAEPGSVGLSGFRRQLKSFFASYEPEKREKGYPVWHPLPFQYPLDPECARHADEFMLGDEMLIAPIYDASGKRALYLPQGTWTNLETNEELPGRRTITVAMQALPVFARTGTIVPLDSAGGMGLHYFPKLASEFFLWDADANDYTQVHASPAADIFRLEIDAKAPRDYQWVVHHVGRPATVGFEELRYREVTVLKELADRTWFYEAARKNLHIRVRVGAGETNIIHIAW